MLRDSSTAVLALAVLVLPACSHQGPDEPILATYPGGEVTMSEYRALAGRLRSDPRKAIEAACLTEWLAARAVAEGVHLDESLALTLRSIENRPWVRALEARIREENEPTEEAIHAYLDENRHRLEKPRKLRLANLFKRAPEDGPADLRAAVRGKMEELRARLLEGEDFQELARKESEGVNRYRGGKMGAVPPGQLRGDVEEIAFALEVGELSEVIAIPEGFILLKNTGVVEPTTMSEEEAIRRIRDAMRRWNFEAAWEALRTELLAERATMLDPRAIDAAAPETVIGTVGDDSITYAQVDSLSRSRSTTGAAAPARLTPFRIHAALERYVFDRLAAARAVELGLEADPQEVARAAAARARALADAELDRRSRLSPIDVSEEEARAFYEGNARLFSLPDRSEVSVIQLRLDDADPEMLRDRTDLASRTVADIRSGRTSFADAARAISEHPSAVDGGDLGMKPRRWAAALGPNVLDAFDRLEPGEVTDPIRQDHLWILRLGDREAGRPLAWEEAATDARWGVERAKRLERRAAIEAELRAEVVAGMEILELPEPMEAPGPGRRRDTASIEDDAG